MSDYLNVMFQSKYAAPGDTVNCMIYLRISKAYKNAKLTCQLEGQEKTALRLKNNRRRNKVRKIVKYSKLTIIRHITKTTQKKRQSIRMRTQLSQVESNQAITSTLTRSHYPITSLLLSTSQKVPTTMPPFLTK